MKQRLFYRLSCSLAILVIITNLIGINPQVVSAEAAPAVAESQAAAIDPTPVPGEDDLRYGYNTTTGMLNFVGGDAFEPLLEGSGEVSAMAFESAGEIVIREYAGEFGIADPQHELKLVKVNQSISGSHLRYQQMYQGIPVLGGEVLVNSDENGSVLSMNGEVSPNLALQSITPKISADQALQTGLAGMKKWHGVEPDRVLSSETLLVVYDQRIFKPGDEPVTLAWKMEMRSDAGDVPVNELVLVDAFSGEISLHFNQIDTSWDLDEAQPTKTPQEEPTASETPTEEPLPVTTSTLEPTPVNTPTLGPVLAETDGEVSAQAGAIRYVSTTGNDSGNNCLVLTAACKTIDRAIGQAVKGDTVKAAVGTYTSTRLNEVIEIWKELDLSGGWNEDFSEQHGLSTLDGQNTRKGITVNTPSTDTVTISRFLITNGKGGDGAGIYINISAGPVIITQCLITNNYSNNTGAVDGSTAGTLTIRNTTITNNTSGIHGGAVYKRGNGDVYLQNVTIVNNTAVSGKGGGIYTSTSKLYIKNSIVANNSAPTNPNCFTDSGALSQGYNLLKVQDKCVDSPGYGDITGFDPLLGALQPGGYFSLLPESPALDGGNPGVPGSGGDTCDAYDQNDTIRPIDGNNDGDAFCDIGAFESNPVAPRAPAAITILRGDPQHVRRNSPFEPLSVIVKDQYGLVLPGISVDFYAPSSGASGVFGTSGTNYSMVTTGSDGIATASTFTSNDIVGTYTVEAAVSGVDSVLFSLENTTPVITLEIVSGDQSAARVNGSFTDVIKIKAIDQDGISQKQLSTTFTAPAEGASGLFPGVNDRQVVVVTDSNGYAIMPLFTANNTVGIYSVELSAQYALPIQFQLENYIPIPSAQIFSGNNQSSGTNNLFPAPLKILMIDQKNKPIQAVEATFTAPDSGQSGIFTDSGNRINSVVSLSDGIASSGSFKANDIDGTYTVTVTVNGVASPLLFTMINTDLFVSVTGSDTNPTGNDCRSRLAPCKTISYAISKSYTGARIFIGDGTYNSIGNIFNKYSLTLSGGWNATFDNQIGQTIVHGSGSGTGAYIHNSGNITIQNIVFENFDIGIESSNNSSIINCVFRNNHIGVQNETSPLLICPFARSIRNG